MEFFKVMSCQQVDRILEEMANNYQLEMEKIDLIDAVDRIVWADYLAQRDLPEFDRSTVDGYAVKCQDVLGVSESMPAFLTASSEVAMGQMTHHVLKPGEAVYVPTGGMVPVGTEAVIMIEYTQKLEDGTLLAYKPMAQGENITLIGDDLRKGDVIVRKGKRLTAYDIGLLASVGFGEVRVWKKPVISVISTGDEIVDAGYILKIGQIRDVNGYALCARSKQLGCEIGQKIIVEDDFNLLRQALKLGLESADVVILSGGSSVGTRDFTKQVIESFDDGSVLVHGIAIKPGKPTIIGRIRGKLVVGLPGHPASALIVFNVFVKKYLDRIQGIIQSPLTIPALLDSNVHGAPGRETYQMVQLMRTQAGLTAVPLYGKSGMMTLLAKATGHIRLLEEQEGLQRGEMVEVELLQEVAL